MIALCVIFLSPCGTSYSAMGHKCLSGKTCGGAHGVHSELVYPAGASLSRCFSGILCIRGRGSLSLPPSLSVSKKEKKLILRSLLLIDAFRSRDKTKTSPLRHFFSSSVMTWLLALQSLPFGGVKDSGYGRFAGPEGLRACCLLKSVTVDRFPKIMGTVVPAPLQVRCSNSARCPPMWLLCRSVAKSMDADGAMLFSV